MTLRKALTVLLAAGVVVATAAGCGSKADDQNSNAGGTPTASASPPTKTTTPTPTPPPAKTADPPVAFDTTTGIDLPGTLLQSNLAGDVTTNFTTLHERTAYIVSAHDMSAIDVLTGEQLWKTPIEGVPADPNAQAGPFVNDAGPRPPVVSEDGGTAVGAFPVTVPGKGTTPAHFAVAVMAVGAEEGDVQWSALVDAPDPNADGDGAIARVLGITDQAVAVTYTTDDLAATFALDPSTQKVLWQQKDYSAGSLNGDVIVGTGRFTPGLPSETQITGLGLLDGKQRWVAADKTYQTAIEYAGPDTAVIAYTDYGSGDETMSFIDPVTGKAKVPALEMDGGTEGLTEFGDCRYDQKSIVVCVIGRLGWSPQLRAFDAASGKQLWQLPKTEGENREVPKLRAVWHGAIYGTTSNGPVMLDAETGADGPDEVGIAPFWVSQYAGIDLSGESNGPKAYPVAN